MKTKCFVKEASVLLVLILMLSSVSVLAENTGAKTVTGTVKPATSGTTWYVDCNAPFGGDGTPDHPFRNINDALYNSELKDGDTIFVKSGTYNEQIQLDQSVNLVGENKDTTIICDEFGDFNGYAIRVYGRSHLTISGFTIKDCRYGGIDIELSNNIIIMNNIFSNNRNDAIELGSCRDNVITGNTFMSNYIDIWLFSICIGNTISYNTFINTGSAIGIGLNGGYNDNPNNKIIGNTIDNSGGISVMSNDNTISGNTITNEYIGIDVDAGRCTVTGNTITKCTDSGIRIFYDGCTVGGSKKDLKNTISNCSIGIEIVIGSYYKNTLIKNNILYDNKEDTNGAKLSKGRQINLLMLLLERFPMLERLLNRL